MSFLPFTVVSNSDVTKRTHRQAHLIWIRKHRTRCDQTPILCHSIARFRPSGVCRICSRSILRYPNTQLIDSKPCRRNHGKVERFACSLSEAWIEASPHYHGAMNNAFKPNVADCRQRKKRPMHETHFISVNRSKPHAAAASLLWPQTRIRA